LNLGNGKSEDTDRRPGSQRSTSPGRGGDFDNDGDLDLLVMNMNEPPSLECLPQWP
jgi:hypothetical protein